MLFSYEAIDKEGQRQNGSIDAINEEVAIQSLQRRGLIISSIASAENKSILDANFTLFERVTNKEIVMLSRQIATLFQAQVSALKVFRMLAVETEKPLLARTLTQIGEDLQSGSSISKALEAHPKVFSAFYVNMVKSGEESGKLDDTFNYLADYLDRNYELVSKARNALVYPAFVVLVFIVVMIFMFTTIIPSITSIITDSGQEIPIYTKIVIAISDFLVAYGLFLLVAVIIGGFFTWRYSKTREGARMFGRIKLQIPYVANLYSKLYLSRLSDNMGTMLASGIPMVRVIEITAGVMGNPVFEDMLNESAQAIRTGTSVSDAFARYPEIPGIMVQMVRVGEETGELSRILDTLSKFYRREVQNAVETLVGMIEPLMIVVLGLGVLLLLVSVLLPIYNMSSGF